MLGSFIYKFTVKWLIIIDLLFALGINDSSAQLPPVVDPGINVKSLQQSQPAQKPTDSVPKIILDERQSKDSETEGQTILVKQIQIEGNTLFDDAELMLLVDVAEGKELSINELRALANKVTDHYLEAGYLLSRAYLPRQEVIDGIVTITVMEGSLDKIDVEGIQRDENSKILKRFDTLKQRAAIRTEELEHILLGLNDIHGLQVQSFLRPGETQGATDMLLRVQESRPYRISADVDNYGSDFTGEIRFGLSGEYDSLLRFGDRLAGRVVKSDDDQNYISMSYSLPLTDDDTRVSFSYVHTDYQLGANLAPLDANGVANILTAMISHPFYRVRSARFDIIAGLDKRYYKNKLLDVTSSVDNLTDIFIGANGYVVDNHSGLTFYDVRLQKGVSGNDPGDPLNSRLLGEADATVASVSVARYQGLNILGSYLRLSAQGQFANSRLLSPDLSPLGGVGTVRGYPLSDVAGDKSYLFSVEYVLPAPIKINGLNTISQWLSFYGFIDHGKVFIKEPQPGESDKTLTGAGGGIRIDLTWLNLNISYAQRIGGSQPSGGSDSVFYLGEKLTY